MKPLTCWFVFLLSLALGGAATLNVGDPAPPLQVSKWIQGEPVKGFARDKVYLVEFWATWCGPCLSSIPHLNELHQRYRDKGLVVIGQDVWEHKVDAVEPFVKKMGPKMTYRVALDTVGEDPEAKGRMAQTWMEAAGQSGIPTAFVVDRKGYIAWIGHPMSLKEEVLEEVLAGKHDIAAAATAYSERRKREEQTDVLWREYSRHRGRGDWGAASSVLDRMEKVVMEDQRLMVIRERMELLLDQDQLEGAYAVGKTVAAIPDPEPMMLNEIAWSLITREGLPSRPVRLAEEIAGRAHRLTKEQNADISDTLARVWFLQGRVEEAIALQEKAIQLTTESRQPALRKVLESYRAGTLPKGDQIRGWSSVLARTIRLGQWEKAEAALAQLDQLDPSKDKAAANYGMERFRVLAGRERYREAYALAKKAVDVDPTDVLLQNRWAWMIVTADGLKERDLEFAEKIARRGHESAQGKNAEIADTLARILFVQGKRKEAIEIQRLAVSAASGQRRADFQANLDSYEAGKLPVP